MERTQKVKETKAKIKNAALEIFREKGYEATTMRLIANKARVALGTIYIYYESKDDLILEYYTDIQETLHEKLKREVFPPGTLPKNDKIKKEPLSELVSLFFTMQIEAMKNDKIFLSGLAGSAATPQNRLSVFSATSYSIRKAHIRVLSEIVEQSKEKLDPQLKSKLPDMLWFIHMGFIFYWIHDQSEGSKKTYQLLQKITVLLNSLLKLQSIPMPFSIKNQVVDFIGQLMALEEQPHKLS